LFFSSPSCLCCCWSLPGRACWSAGSSPSQKRRQPLNEAPSLRIPSAVTFEVVEPIFAAHCIHCHSGPQAPQGLRLDGYDSALDRRERAWIVPGHPTASEVSRRIRGLSRPAMPFNQPSLSVEQIELIEAWILQGARSVHNVPALLPVGAMVRLNGTLTSMWSLDGLPLLVDGGTRIDDFPAVGSYVEVRGVVLPEGAIRAVRIRRR
jgi:hypothetical protein